MLSGESEQQGMMWADLTLASSLDDGRFSKSLTSDFMMKSTNPSLLRVQGSEWHRVGCGCDSPFSDVADDGRARAGNKVQGAHGVDVAHGRIRVSDLNGCDAERPDIAAVIVLHVGLPWVISEQ